MWLGLIHWDKMVKWDKFGTNPLPFPRAMKETTIKVSGATLVEREYENKKTAYQVKIRHSGVKITRTFNTKKEALEFITLTNSKIIKGESVVGVKIKKTPLGKIFQEYIDENPSIAKNKKRGLERLILEIGSIPLENFKTDGFEKYIKTKLSQDVPDQAKKKKDHPHFNANRVIVDGKVVKKKYKEATIRKYYYYIKNALEWHARVHDYVFNSKPFDEVKAPSAWKSPNKRRLKPGEFELLINACEKLYKRKEETRALISFLVWSAFRVGETFKIKYSDIHINETNPEFSYIFIPKENQKTAHTKGAEDRYASLRPELYYLLKDVVLKWKHDPDDYVFSMWKTTGYFYSRFKTVCRNAKVDALTVHNLRSEALSWFFENTTLTDIEISKISGHIELDTLKMYANLRPDKTGQKLWNKM